MTADAGIRHRIIYAPRVTPTAGPNARRSWWPYAALAIAVVLLCAVGAWHPWSTASGPSGASAAGAVPAAGPMPLELPDDPRVLVLGDSWTYGSAAHAPTLGYAYLVARELGWDAVVNGVRGSGYLKPGLDGGTFGERIADLDPAVDPDLVIVQGSINDRHLPAAGYRDAVARAWDSLRDLYPDAAVIILGPAPQVLPVEASTARIDADLSALSAERGWWYISPIAEDWITPGNYLEVIDTSIIGRDHPSTEGHAHLAERLTAALDARMASTTVIADAPHDATVG